MKYKDGFVSWKELEAESRPTDPEGLAAYERGFREARLARLLAELVYNMRKEAGLTQKQLAERMGTTQSAISRMENFGVVPTLDILSRLGTALGVELTIGFGPGKQVPLNVA